jgi:hypothetical protein
MARRKRTYRAPVVITLAALAPGCVQGLMADGSGGTPGTGGTSSGGDDSGDGRSSGGRTSTGGTATGGGATVPDCEFDYPYTPCTPGANCVRAMDCTSGLNRTFLFECNAEGTSFAFQTEYCENPSEFCAGSGWDEAATCESGAWMYQGQGGNPPGPCPDVLPAEGSDCTPGAFGGDRDACGYPCGGDAWTVTGCVPDTSVDPEYPYEQGSWQSDGVCSAGGAGGADP